MKELRENAPSAPIMLVGTKVDLRDDESKAAVKPSEGEQAAKSLGVYGYLECSALTQKGLKKVFDEAVKAVLRGREKPKKKKSGGFCRIL